jgi:hypothetical protein
MAPRKIENHGSAAGNPWMRVFLHLAAAAVLLTSLRIGVRGFLWDLKAAFGDSPRHAIPPEIETRVASLRGRIPPGESLFYVGNQQPPDPWFSRLWQRAFYPMRVVTSMPGRVLTSPTFLRSLAPRAERLRSPCDPLRDLRWNPRLIPDSPREELAPIPSYPYTIWFGAALNPRLLSLPPLPSFAAVLALAGDLVLARRSSRFSQWIESFLVGAGVSAAPCSPVARSSRTRWARWRRFSPLWPPRAVGAVAESVRAAVPPHGRAA